MSAPVTTSGAPSLVDLVGTRHGGDAATAPAPADLAAIPGGAALPLVAASTRLRSTRVIGLATALVLLGAVILLSLAVGTKPIPLRDVIDALFAFDGSQEHIIVRDLRLPRTLVGLSVGAALGVSGALMQGVTRNPLAEPGLLGVNAGASFAVVVAIAGFGVGSVSGYVWFAFVGAGVTSVLVYLLGSMGRGGATPVRLALAGAAFTALLGSLTSAVIILDRQTLDQYRFWAVGSLAGRDLEVLQQVAPFLVVGLAIAYLCAGPLNAIGLGDDVARGLGTKVGLTRAAAAVAVMLLCGGATAACGPIGFIGLVVPLAARAIAGTDQRWLLRFSAVLGALVLVGCDIVGRVIARPSEVQVGIMTAAIGGPAFVILVRRVRMAAL